MPYELRTVDSDNGTYYELCLCWVDEDTGELRENIEIKFKCFSRSGLSIMESTLNTLNFFLGYAEKEKFWRPPKRRKAGDRKQAQMSID